MKWPQGLQQTHSDTKRNTTSFLICGVFHVSQGEIHEHISEENCLFLIKPLTCKYWYVKETAWWTLQCWPLGHTWYPRCVVLLQALSSLSYSLHSPSGCVQTNCWKSPLSGGHFPPPWGLLLFQVFCTCSFSSPHVLSNPLLWQWLI